MDKDINHNKLIIQGISRAKYTKAIIHLGYSECCGGLCIFNDSSSDLENGYTA